MASGETPPTGGRFSSPASTNISNRKYPGTPKSPMLGNAGSGNRNSQARQRLLSNKVSAPRPVNLPSLKREHEAGSDVPVSSPSTSHGWGSASNSPSLTTQSEAKPLTTEQRTPEETHSPVLVPSHPSSSTTNAWAVPSITQTKPSSPSAAATSSNTPPPPSSTSTDFPTAAEAVSGSKKKPSLIDDKDYLMFASSDPNHRSWDEMVNEDLDDNFSVDVIEFDDGTKVQLDNDTTVTTNTDSSTPAATTETDPVSPSDRFPEDYDRSYPPKQKNQDDSNSSYRSYRRSEDHSYHSSRHHNPNYDRRHSTEGRSASNERWPRRDSMEGGFNRRPSYDRKHDHTYHNHHQPQQPPQPHHSGGDRSYQPTLLQRPRRMSNQSFRSDHSREDHVEHSPLQIIQEPPADSEEIIVAQKNLMLTAAERAKKRLEEREAEFKAAEERAKQKAAALAAKQAEEEKLKEKAVPEKKTIVKKPETTSATEAPIRKKPSSVTEPATPPASTSSASESTPAAPVPAPSPKIIGTSKPWNLVAAKKEAPSTEKKPAVKTPTETSKEPSETVKQTKEDTKPTDKKNSDNSNKNNNSKPAKELNKDEKNWKEYVTKLRSDQVTGTHENVTSSDWNSYAVRLQESVDEENAARALARQKLREQEKTESKQQKEKIVEVLDYQESQDLAPVSLHSSHSRGADRGGWVREEGLNYSHGSRGRGKGNKGTAIGGSRGRRDARHDSEHWRHEIAEKDDTPVVTEILKHDPVEEKKDTKVPKPVILSKKARLTNLLKESSSPIFPDFIEKLAGKKPAYISFMVDNEESDEEITTMAQAPKEDAPTITPDMKAENPNEAPADMETADVEAANNPVANVDENTGTTNSTASTPPRSQYQQDSQMESSPHRMNVNPHYPTLVYRYPTNQQPHLPSKDNGPNNNSFKARPKGTRHRPMGVYFMPQQPFMTNNQYMVPFPPAGTSSMQPIYLPTLSWQQQQPQHGYTTSISPRPHYEQRRPYNKHDEWNMNGYQNQRYDNNSSYSRGSSYRKRGGGSPSWSGHHTGGGRGRGNHHNYSNSNNRRYNDDTQQAPSYSPSAAAEQINEPSFT